MDFLFDFLSPYAFLASRQIGPLAARHGRTVTFVPVALGALLSHGGQLGPAEIPAKRRWVWLDVTRRAHALGLRLTPPPAHPFNPLLALRVATLAPETIPTLFDAVWGGGPGVAEPAAVAGVLSEAGFDGPGLVARSGEAREPLRRATEAAIAAGAFGVPTVLVDGALFWGLDGLGDVEAFLRGSDPADRAGLARWEHTPAAVDRFGPIHGLNHLSLGTTKVAAMARFYGALGFREYFRDEHGVQLLRDKDVIALDAEAPGVRHFGFRLRRPAEIDGVVDALVEAGGTLVRRGEFAPGLPFAYVKDPDGNLAEIWFE